ncbi:MAG: iron-containing alcohol dehydrogenase [Bacteroidales bacterium]|nr:iron-containing alcohol dehydrogenase [Bacteroidales bacterium]
MEKFVLHNPTKLYFGKNSIQNLEKEANNLGKKALILFGKNSAKKNGAYTDIVKCLKKLGVDFVEFWGIKPNPRINEAYEAINIGIKEKVDFIIAVGGGSTIDTAKFVSLCIPEKHDLWKVVKEEVVPQKALPLIVILTLSATGSEMNCFAVIQNDDTKEKLGFAHPLIYPKISICDPTYTLTVSPQQTAYGIADIISHLLEAYFGECNSYLADKYVFATFKEIVEIALPLLKNPTNYELRERIMIASTFALNGITYFGRKTPDWGVHEIAHNISALFDTPHGASLSIVYPAWLKFFKQKINDRLRLLGKNVFNVNNSDKVVERLIKFFKSLNCPTSLNDINLKKVDYENLNNLLIKNKPSGYVYKIKKNDYKKLIKLMT